MQIVQMVADRAECKANEQDHGPLHRGEITTLFAARLAHEWLQSLYRRRTRQGQGIEQGATNGKTQPMTNFGQR